MWFRDGLKRTEKNEAGEVKGPGMIDGNVTEPPSMNEETNDIDSMMAELRAAMEDPKPILINQVCYEAVKAFCQFSIHICKLAQVGGLDSIEYDVCGR